MKWTNNDLAEMGAFYREEYDRTLSRLAHIKSVLEKLGEKVSDAFTTARQGNQVSKPKTERRGRKSHWEALILKRLRQVNKPMTYEEFVDDLMVFNKWPESKRTSTKQALVVVVYRLRTKSKKLATFSIGKRQKYIALSSWFESPGVIKKEYLARVPAVKPKKVSSGKRGRPPGSLNKKNIAGKTSAAKSKPASRKAASVRKNGKKKTGTVPTIEATAKLKPGSRTSPASKRKTKKISKAKL